MLVAIALLSASGTRLATTKVRSNRLLQVVVPLKAAYQ